MNAMVFKPNIVTLEKKFLSTMLICGFPNADILDAINDLVILSPRVGKRKNELRDKAVALLCVFLL